MKINEKKAKAFTVKGAAVLIIAATLAAVLLFTGCKQSTDNSGGETPAPPEIGYEFVAIPEATIVGVDPDYTLPGTEAYWKGVFVKNRTVKLSAYKLGKTEVTYKLWKEVYDWAIEPENGYTFANQGKKGSHNSGDAEKQPVTEVSWRDCIVWCNAYTEKEKGIDACVYRKSKNDSTVLKDATAKDGEEYICDAAYADMSKKGFKLPSEAEWEYAARWQGIKMENAEQYGDVWLTKLNSASGAKADWHDSEKTGEVAWYDGNSENKTHPAGKKRENALVLHDMSGNVLEWCFDRYDDDPTSNDSAYEQDGIITDPQGAASGAYRVSRGGSWYCSADRCAVGVRYYYSPGIVGSNLGFRLAWCP